MDLLTTERLATIEAPAGDPVVAGQRAAEVLGDRQIHDAAELRDRGCLLAVARAAVAELTVDIATPAQRTLVERSRAAVRAGGGKLGDALCSVDLAHRQILAAQDRKHVAIATYDLAVASHHAQ